MLPEISKFGDCQYNFVLKNISFFRVGGPCKMNFSPFDETALSEFLKIYDSSIICLGNLSNVLISDEGLNCCVVDLKKHFNKVIFNENFVDVGAGVSLSKFINYCVARGISCIEHLSCIPGTIGGAISMNAGIPDFEIADALVSITCVEKLTGKILTLDKRSLNMEYRNGKVPKDFIVISAKLQTTPQDKETLKNISQALIKKRKKTQPIGQKTCGSTFKNPPGQKAWQLIKESDCDKLSVGDAKVSEMHCNFLINSGNARSADFFKLIQEIKERVLKKTGFLLEEEIKILVNF